jgi:hypothetical protein
VFECSSKHSGSLHQSIVVVHLISTRNNAKASFRYLIKSSGSLYQSIDVVHLIFMGNNVETSYQYSIKFGGGLQRSRYANIVDLSIV